jgi:transposase InsO family protein
MRLMQENGLSVRPRRRFVATTDSDHDGPIFPNLAKDVVPGRTQPALGRRQHLYRHRGRFVYLAAILDVWSRRVVGYGLSSKLDTDNFTYGVKHKVDAFPAKLDAHIREWQKKTLDLPLPVTGGKGSHQRRPAQAVVPVGGSQTGLCI